MVALITDVQVAEAESCARYSQLTEPVIVFYGHGDVPIAKGFAKSTQLFRLLWRCGREREPLQMVIKGGQVLTDESLAALNLFLHYGRGLRLFPSVMGSTKYGWRDLQEFLELKWRPISERR